jgi:outer membrane protein OmpA-like peptidoglycan-associated protein
MILNGRYTGQDLYVQNSNDGSSAGFCTEKVTVNGKEYVFSNESAYAINLKEMNFKPGDSIEIVILHKPDCKPKVLTAFVNPKSDFNIKSISIDGTWVLKWKSLESGNKNPYFVEQFIDNKWIVVAEVESWGSQFEREYRQQVTPNPGKNSFRVKQVDNLGRTKISSEVTLLHEQNKVKFKRSVSLKDSMLSPGDYYTTHNILWEVGRWALLPQSSVQLDSVIAFIQKCPNCVFEIGVHRDNRPGYEKLSWELTQKRAESIKQYLEIKGVNGTQLKAFGYGGTMLLVPDKTIKKAKTKEEQEALHQKNRRVTVKVLGRKDE